LHENCDETLVSLYGEALDYAERMKSRQLTSFHFLLAYFSAPSEAAVIFEEKKVTYKDVAEAYNDMIKMSRLSGSSLKEPVDTIKTLEIAAVKYILNKGQLISPLHFLLALLTARNSIAHRILQKMGVLTDIRLAAMKLIDEPAKRIKDRAEEMKRESTRISGVQTKEAAQTQKVAESGDEPETSQDNTPKNGAGILSKYGRNLTELAAKGGIDPVFGRSKEIETIIDILGRKRNNNPLLIGPSGSGKTAVVEAIALRQMEGLLPNVEIWELNLTSIVGGTEYRGSLEKRIGDLMEFVEKNSDRIIIFIDEIHLIFSIGNETVANMLKPMLSRGTFPLIGATTTAEFNKYIAKDPAMERRFSIVKIDEPKGEDLFRIVSSAAKTLGSYHTVSMESDDIVRSAIALSDRYISGKSQPDKVLSLLDTLGSVLKREKRTEAEVEDLMTLVSDRTGIPIENLLVDTSRIMNALPVILDRSIVGQAGAKGKIIKLLARRFGNRVRSKPLASMIFAGPTGTGKTEMAKKLASFLFGGEDRMVVFDMSEFQEQHSISKLIGAPPGYTGYEDGGKLTESFRREPYQLLLLDEIEKAHPKVLSILLQILEEGRVTDTRGFAADMSESIVIMTSNIGSDLFLSSKVGFNESGGNGVKDSDILSRIESFISPELLNRIDDVAVFKPFSNDEFLVLAETNINETVNRLSLNEGASIVIEDIDSISEYITGSMSTKDKQMGARAVKRLVGRLVEGPLLEHCCAGHDGENSCDTLISVNSTGIVFSRKKCQ